jgi:predicted RNase H-like HicB family nuclease
MADSKRFKPKGASMSRTTTPKKPDRSVITLQIKLETLTRKDGDQWLAWCLPLDVMSQGNTHKAALAGLREAIQLWFESCIQRGVLDEALKEAGFQSGSSCEDVPASADNFIVLKKSQEWHEKSRSSEEYIEVMIPAYIAAQIAEPCAAR